MSKGDRSFEDLLNKLTTEDNAIKSDSFALFSSFDRSEEVQKAYDFFTNRGDLQSIHTLLAYLLHVRSRQSFLRLVELTENENAVIREEAIEAIKEIPPDESTALLIKIMHSKYSEVRLFAVRQVGILRSRGSVMPLIDWLKEHEEKEDLVAGLIALGSIGDDRCVPSIEKMFPLFQKDKETLEQALLTLGIYSAFVSKRFLKKCVNSENKMIREATHLAILKLLEKKWESFTSKGLKAESDPKIKMNILSSIRTVQTERLFEAILILITRDSNEGVRMMAQTVLKRIRSEKILKWLLRCELKSKGKSKEQILRLLVMYPNDPQVVKVYKKNSLQEKNLHLKLVAIEYMGYTGSKETIPFLKSLILSGEKYAYVASISLSHLLRKSDQSTFLEMISIDSKIGSPVVQMYLRLILRLKNADVINEEIRVKIIHLTESSEHNIRYLALRCLSRWDCSENLEMMTRFAVNDPVPMVRFAAKISIAEMLSSSIDRVEDFALLITPDVRLCQTAYEVIKRVNWHRVFYREILKAMIRSILRTDHQGVSARISAIVRILIRDKRALFLDAFCNLDWDSEEFLLLIRIATKTPIQTWYGLKSRELITIYQKSNVNIKLELLKLFSKLEIKDKEIKDLVFSEIGKEELENIPEAAKETVLTWVEVASGVNQHG